MTKTFTIPSFERTIAEFTFTWEELALTIELQRVDDDARGEIGIYHQNGNGRELLKYSRISLLNSRDTDSLAKSLESNNNIDLDWHQIMTHVTAKTIQALCDGMVVENINQEPSVTNVDWAAYPFLIKGEPTTIFAPGGSTKSLFADLLSFSQQTGITIPGLPFLKISQPCNVLYLDWERDDQIHQQRITAIKTALKVENRQEIHYVRCERPITAIIDNLVKKIAELNIGSVYIDSQMAATAGMGSGRTDAEVASEYYNCLRRFNCTTLSIDHTTKASTNGTTGDTTDSPFGSIVKYNRATSVYRIESDQDTDSDMVQFRLKHTKFNLGRKQKDRGIQVQFVNEGEGPSEKLIAIHFSEFDLSENTNLRKKLPRWQIYEAVLRSARRPMSCGDIANEAHAMQPEAEHNSKKVFDTLRQQKDHFVKLDSEGKLWGLLNYGK